MERMLGVLNEKADMEILVCKLEFESDKFSYCCNLLRNGVSMGWATMSNLKEIANHIVGILKEDIQADVGLESFVVRFPSNHIVSTNIFGQLNLLTSIPINEQREFFLHFAAEFRRLGLDAYHAKMRERLRTVAR